MNQWAPQDTQGRLPCYRLFRVTSQTYYAPTATEGTWNRLPTSHNDACFLRLSSLTAGGANWHKRAKTLRAPRIRSDESGAAAALGVSLDASSGRSLGGSAAKQTQKKRLALGGPLHRHAIKVHKQIDTSGALRFTRFVFPRRLLKPWRCDGYNLLHYANGRNIAPLCSAAAAFAFYVSKLCT